jgi:hypothetical protein
MATSHYALEKNATTEKWFAAAKTWPLKGVTNIGYNPLGHGQCRTAALELKDDSRR